MGTYEVVLNTVLSSSALAINGIVLPVSLETG